VWHDAAIAGVVVAGFVVAGLICASMVNRMQHILTSRNLKVSGQL
jgi:hypothetical protein